MVQTIEQAEAGGLQLQAKYGQFSETLVQKKKEDWGCTSTVEHPWLQD